MPRQYHTESAEGADACAATHRRSSLHFRAERFTRARFARVFDRSHRLPINAQQIKQLAHTCGFELAGIAPALPQSRLLSFRNRRAAGYAADMRYLTDHRG